LEKQKLEVFHDRFAQCSTALKRYQAPEPASDPKQIKQQKLSKPLTFNSPTPANKGNRENINNSLNP
jgi:hypothetical protein